MTDVKFPFMRLNVIDALESLADFAKGETTRSSGRTEGGGSDALTLNVHLLYDDTEVLPDPSAQLGDVLLPDDVEPLRRLDSVLGPLLTRLGDGSDVAFLSDPAWPAVVDAAQAAFVSLKSRGDTDHWISERRKG